MLVAGRSLKALVTAVATALVLATPAGAAPRLKVGVGRADITPPTGYYMMGWVRSDGLVTGQQTRLWARVIVLKEGGRKIAVVAEDLNGIPGGMMAAAARRDRDIGFSQRNVVDSASHTHAAPTGFYNFSTYDTVFMSIDSPTQFNLTGSLDPQLYAFEVRRLARAIRRANANLGPGAVGWGATTIDKLTKNRSIEAHLYDHGIQKPYGTGSPAMDPRGPLHTIDPNVNVLRVDKLIGGRRVPVGIWSTFADHGTVNKFQFTYYNEDHHGAATQLVEKAIRRAGHVPRSQDVVNAYGNTDEGDMSAGLDRSGPAAAEYVGGVEASAFLRAWRQAGRRMQRSPALAWRWTRMCWCGQQTPDGPVDDHGVFGLPQFTGSEEGRGPLFDVTRVPFEGDHLPVGAGPQGNKLTAPIPVDAPKAVPLIAVRVADRMIVSVPGEMTEEMGRRVRHAVLGAAGSGVHRAVISGLANEYADYFTTPEEYDAQHYEGGATLYGRTSADALEQVLVELTSALVAGNPAPAPYPYDPRNGVSAHAPRFPRGAASAAVVAQPAANTRRLRHPKFSWRGASRGFDRPLDRAFVLVQRWDHRRRWRTTESDLGLDLLWTVDDNGVYRAEWEPPFDARLGTYRFKVRANRYGLGSRRFRLRASRKLLPRRVKAPPGRFAIVLDYPPAHAREQVGDPVPDANASLTSRPRHARSGHVAFLVNGQPVTVAAGPGGRFQVAAAPGDRVEIRPGAGRDRHGNRNRNGVVFQA